MSAIFRKAKAVARLVKQMDYGVSLSCRTTAAGHSAVLRARRVMGHVYIERGFQIQDREGAGEPLGLAEFPTIIDRDDIAVAKLVKLCMVPNEALDILALQIPAPRIIPPGEQHAALQVARHGRRDRNDEGQAHLQRMNTWLAQHCPDYGTLTRTAKEKVRQRACMDLYGATSKAA
jgi:hypothetical protein